MPELRRLPPLPAFALLALLAGAAALAAPIPPQTPAAPPAPAPTPPAPPQPAEPPADVASGWRELPIDGQEPIHYIIRFPENFQPGGVAPALLLLPPGGQSREMAGMMAQSVQEAAFRRGWVVVAPAARKGSTFFAGDDAHVPALLAAAERVVRPEGGKWHVAGVSNGGISALRIAVAAPARVASVVAYPGYARPEERRRLRTLAGIPVRLLAGADESLSWREQMQLTLSEGKRAGLDITLREFPAEGHVLRSFRGADLITLLEEFRVKTGTSAPEAVDAAATLDALHDAAARADFDGYFALYAPEGVFLGTDASERWDLEAFKAYAKPHFDRKKGWVYRPVAGSRHITLAPAADPARAAELAWFDELLRHDKYGTCRGTGVLRRIDGRWRVAQYHLTVPVPNALLDRVARMIEVEERRAK